jgi:type IV secretion system protein TrbB
MKRQLGSFCGLLHESDVVELMLNADGVVWVDRLGRAMQPVGMMPPATAESFIATVASTLRSTVTRENPILECEFPLDGSRFEALIPPVVPARYSRFAARPPRYSRWRSMSTRES